MAEAITFQLWVGRTAYILLAVVVVFVRLLPLGASPGGLPVPDLLVCLTFAWVLRRPDHVPPLLVAAVFLICDLIFLRPPGLWALVMLAATEFLRAREGLARELPFPLEWAMVAAVLVVAVLAEALVLGIFMVPGLDVGVGLLHALATLAAYPVVVAALWLGLGLRRAAPGEVDRLGRPL